MIKNIPIRINADQRPAITVGRIGANGKPAKLNHFNLEHYPEVKEIYGDEPQNLVIYMPSDDLKANFDCNFEAWGSKGNPVKKRQCDGETCTHRIPENFCGVQYAAGDTSVCACKGLDNDDRTRCRYAAWLKAYIADPNDRTLLNPSCYMFRTHSKNSGDAIYSELMKALGLTQHLFGVPRLMGIPFLLTVVMASKSDDASRTFPIWKIQAIAFDMPRLSMANAAELGIPDDDMVDEVEPAQLVAAQPALPSATVAPAAPTTVAPSAPAAPQTVAPPESDEQRLRREIEELGTRLLGDRWAEKRSAACEHATNGGETDIEKLLPWELDRVLRDLQEAEKKAAERSQQAVTA